MKTQATHPNHPQVHPPAGVCAPPVHMKPGVGQCRRKGLAARLVPLAALLLVLNATVQAQFNYEIHDGTATITGYAGAVIWSSPIPSRVCWSHALEGGDCGPLTGNNHCGQSEN